MGGKNKSFLSQAASVGTLGASNMFQGAQKVKGFNQDPKLQQYEDQMLARQNAIASGQTPLVATQEAQNAAQSTAASARGLANPALAARAASQQVTQEGLAAAMRERQMADQMIAQQAAAQRGVALQQAGMNQQAEQAYRGQALGAISGIGQTAAALSDETMKKDIKPANASKDLEAFVGALKSYDYKYKDPSKPGAGKGEHTGVMAQDLEKSDIGKQAVVETENGKMVHYDKLVPAMLAAIVEINKKLKKG